MTEEARNLIAEMLDQACIVKLAKGRILFVPNDATSEQIQAAITRFEKELNYSENGQNTYIAIDFSELK